MKSILYVVSIWVLLIQCVSPLPISSLQPTSEDYTWYFGKELMSQKIENVEASILFRRNEEGYLVFDLEIINHSDQPALVAPESFVIVSSNIEGEIFSTVNAIDPEEKLRSIEIDMSRQSARETNMAIANALEVTTEIAGDIASMSDNVSNEERAAWDVQTAQRSIERDQDMMQIERTIISLNDSRDFWENDLLRKTTLPSGHSINGLVYFQQEKKALNYDIQIPVGNTTFHFEYLQRLIYP